jgi:hypothetical protein
MSYVSIPHAKERGEWGELCFMARAAEHGLRVTKPWGDSAPYDFAIEHNGTLPSRPGQMHATKTLELLPLPSGFQRRPLSTRSDRLHRRIRNPRRHLVHPPNRRHRGKIRHPPNAALPALQTFEIQGSVAFAETMIV